MIRVLVVDDHKLVRTGTCRLLADEEGIEIIGQASSGEEAIMAVRAQQAGCGLDGCEYARHWGT